MAKPKAQRWMLVFGNEVHIYDAPYANQSQSVSIVNKTDVAYYRANFNLQVAWGTTAPANV